MKRHASLDGLRGLAVGLVLASHSSNAGFDAAPGLDARGVGRAGVFLFFVLSSYLLTAQCLDARERGLDARERGLDAHEKGLDARTGSSVAEPSSAGAWWARFAARRVLRILPAYALILGLYVAFGAFDLRVATQHLALIRAEAHFWTIPVEVLFYVTLPLITLALGALRGTAPRLALLAVCAVASRLAFPPDYPARAPDFRPNVAPFVPVFLVGSALAVARPLVLDASRRTRRILDALGGAALVGLALLAPAVWQRLVGEPVHHTRFHLWFDVHGLLFGLVVLATLPREPGWLARAAACRLLAWLGLVSYSVYLVHAMVFSFVQARAPGVGVAAAWVGPLSIAGAVAAGAASYALVERPFLGVLRGRRNCASSE